MQILNLAWLLALSPAFAMAADPVDTFGKLLAKQAQVLDSEMEAKIRANQAQSGGAAGTPLLPGVNQQASEKEPTVDAIWGLAGEEVAEITYKGRRVPVSVQAPYISKIDGWKLESINPYEVVLVKMHGKTVGQRKTILFDWQSGESKHAARAAQSGLAVPIVIPPIAGPALRE